MRDDDQMTEFTFKDLLAPLSMDQFFRDHYQPSRFTFREMSRNPTACSHGLS